jgi:hypothetical protein
MKPMPNSTLVPFEAICFIESKEWLEKKLLPRQGLAVIRGSAPAAQPIVAELTSRVCLGWDWRPRRTKHATVVLVAAGASNGLRACATGFDRAHGGGLLHKAPLRIISAAIDFSEDRGRGVFATAMKRNAVWPGAGPRHDCASRRASWRRRAERREPDGLREERG